MLSISLLLLVLGAPSCLHFVAVENHRTTLSDRLRWNFTRTNPDCTSPDGRNSCEDVRICKFAVASVLMGGWPTLCGWVGKDVPRVCCGLPLVLGEALIKKVNEEKARKRECGRTTYSSGLSEIENKFFEVWDNLPDIDLSNPEKFDPPLDQRRQTFPLPASGRPSRQEDFPWMVAIYKGSTFWCGGSLIDRVHILSAAHCFVTNRRKSDPDQFTVLIGNIEVDSGVTFQVSNIKIHENYDPSEHFNDIAILTLSSEILEPSIAHVCLPDKTLSAVNLIGKSVSLLGWGDASFGGRMTPLLHIIDDMIVVSNAACSKNYSLISAREIPDNMICARRPEGGKEACQQKDSGGPLMYRNRQPNVPDYEAPWVLIGIVSYSYKCGEQGFPGVYTRVSSYTDWIEKNSLHKQ